MLVDDAQPSVGLKAQRASRRSATSCVDAARFVRGPDQLTCRVKEFGTMDFREAQRFGPTGQDTVAGW